MIQADAAQLEQLLINILHNAVEASLETGGDGDDAAGAIWRIAWKYSCATTGPGIMNPTNLFVPFFTTKPGRIRNWSGLEPANRGSAWRIVDSGESQRTAVAKRCLRLPK